MKVGILGAGVVAQALGLGFATLGHDVMISSRDPNSSKVKEWVTRTGARASAGTFAEAAGIAEIAVLATLWSGTESAITLAGPRNLAGKILIDVTNPLVFHPNSLPTMLLGPADSGGEQVQRWLTGARVVKAFNTVGHDHFFKPQFPGGPPDMFLCGNDAEAKTVVAETCSAFGWPTIDIGGIEGARLLESLALLWITYYFRSRSRNHAFKLLRK